MSCLVLGSKMPCWIRTSNDGDLYTDRSVQRAQKHVVHDDPGQTLSRPVGRASVEVSRGYTRIYTSLSSSRQGGESQCCWLALVCIPSNQLSLPDNLRISQD